MIFQEVDTLKFIAWLEAEKIITPLETHYYMAFLRGDKKPMREYLYEVCIPNMACVLNKKAELLADVREHGIIEPLVLDVDRRDLKGLFRLAIAKHLNLPTVPLLAKDGWRLE